MKILSNVHTHSTWCDGQNTPREIIERAIELGFTDIGFSSHAPAPFDPACPGIADEAAYRAEIGSLREEYKNNIGVLCGVEQDYYAPVDASQYDYIIGSNHYLPYDGEAYVAADDNAELISVTSYNRYQGDSIAMVRAFYELSVLNIQKNKPDIVGHFDVITKFNRDNTLFNENSTAYQNTALEALDAIIDVILPYGGMIEMNTGAVNRGLRSLPYPAPFLLRHILQRGARVIITSDSHNINTLNSGFAAALQQLQSMGFQSVSMLQHGKFADVKIV